MLPQIRSRVRAKLEELAEDLLHGSIYADMCIKRDELKLITISVRENDEDGRYFYLVDHDAGRYASPDPLQILHFAALALQARGLGPTESYELICASKVIDDDLPF